MKLSHVFEVAEGVVVNGTKLLLHLSSFWTPRMWIVTAVLHAHGEVMLSSAKFLILPPASEFQIISVCTGRGYGKASEESSDLRDEFYQHTCGNLNQSVVHWLKPFIIYAEFILILIMIVHILEASSDTSIYLSDRMNKVRKFFVLGWILVILK